MRSYRNVALLRDNPKPITDESWQTTDVILLNDLETGETLYECCGIYRNQLVYFMAEFIHPEPVLMVLLDVDGYVLGTEEIRVDGKFGPGVVIRNKL